MDKFIINGGIKLKGEVAIGGSKNAALAIISAATLTDETCTIDNIPRIDDVLLITNLLVQIGVRVRFINKNTVEIDPKNISGDPVDYDLAKQIRASYYMIGALLSRFSEASVSLPGGCNFGVRPIDQHLKAFARLGAKHEISGGMVKVKAKDLVGNNVYFDVVSVGATINLILAAVKAKGMTTIENAAKEPHVVDLANFLNSMGADIRGAGTDVIKVHGVSYLRSTRYSVIPDQIEAGTYMVASAITGGDILIKRVIPKHLESIKSKLEEMGVKVEEFEDSIRVLRKNPISKCNVKTMPHPGFPTDMQPQISAFLTLSNGTSIISESVWDNRYRYVEELKRMGANISVDGKVCVIEGVKRLTGTSVKATDLRAGAALIIAALSSCDQTVIEGISHIERGYEDICGKLRSLGADVRKFSESPAQSTFQKAL